MTNRLVTNARLAQVDEWLTDQLHAREIYTDRDVRLIYTPKYDGQEINSLEFNGSGIMEVRCTSPILTNAFIKLSDTNVFCIGEHMVGLQGHIYSCVEYVGNENNPCSPDGNYTHAFFLGLCGDQIVEDWFVLQDDFCERMDEIQAVWGKCDE